MKKKLDTTHNYQENIFGKPFITRFNNQTINERLNSRKCQDPSKLPHGNLKIPSIKTFSINLITV